MDFRVEFEAAQIIAGPNEDGILQRDIVICENHTVTSLGFEALSRCSKLERVSFPAATHIGNYAFYQCRALTSVYFPRLEYITGTAFLSCESLSRVRLPRVTFIGGNAFAYCTKLESVVIEQSASVCFLGNASAFANTPIANGTGFIYVPDALVEDYKKAANWSTYAAQIKPLSELSE